MSAYLAVKNFREFQHYRDRTPPWIKLYSRLLEDYDFLALSDAARGQLILIWLVASRCDNRLPDDRRWLARAIHATSPVRLDELKRGGWLVPIAAPEAEQSASKTLAEPERSASNLASTLLAAGYQDAPPPCARGEAETETETETYNTPPPRAREAVRSQLPERYQGDLDRVLERVAVPDSLFATLEAMHSGLTPPAYTWDEIGLGLHDLVTNGQHVRFNARQLRRYVQGAREQLTPTATGAGPPGVPGRKLTIGERVFLKASGGAT